ncbi:TetR/AcrR family transcriptional regulator [Pseudonocardia spinosispora]|uniref:TetR/AcrR family transcriptional regulator n=1 Tax=Pseudonocardia spinosispora TaxID=103441 RepID=UPI0004121822|nr:TetR/AcrR family transcriptional regulator [Pseudonocardia spinosispora]
MESESEPAHSPRVTRRRARTRERILDVAEEIFGSGYQAARMEELAETADVSVGTIYVHFGNKAGLYLALAERALDQFADYLKRADRPDYSPIEKVMACGELYLRFHLEHPGSFRFLAFDGFGTELPQVDEQLRTRVGERLDDILGIFQAYIEAAIAAGEADPAYTPREVCRFLWGAWNGVVSFSLRNDRMALTDEEIATCLRLGRRLANEGLTAPRFRTPDGYSRGRLVDL